MLQIKKIISRIKTGEQDNTATGQIGKVLLAAQRKAADYLNRKTARWSLRRVKLMLILFCLLTGNISLFLIGRAVLSANGPPGNFEVTRLAAPSRLSIPGKPSRADSLLKEHIPNNKINKK